MRKHIPSMQSLLAFHAVARFGSTVLAADHLNVTPSAVSHQLRKIEDLLGVKLYRQSGRNIELTSAGNRYASKIGEALNMIAESSATLDETEPHGELTICCSEGIGSFWFSRRIGRFASRFPNLSIRLITPVDSHDVYRANVDVSIVYGDGNWKDLQVHLLYALTFFPVCSPTLIENMGKISQTDDLADYRLLHHTDHSDWAAWLAAAKVKKVDGNSGIVFSDINHSLSAAIAGNGIAIADNVLVSDSLRDGSLIRLFNEEIPGPKSYYLVASANKCRQPACAAFIDWILAEVQQ
jgi:LysR family glycine cleavage system transcriptional activator